MYGFPSSSRVPWSSSYRPAWSPLSGRSFASFADRLSDVVKCSKPFTRGLDAFGCGQCLPCRINKQRMWTTRLVLEASVQPGFFVTLTYNQQSLPKEGLSKIHCQQYLKNLRRSVAPRTVRYFCVGEYGEKFGRPHYHLALFGALVPREIVAAWPHGIVDVRLLARDSASYICGYILKGNTSSSDVACGRTPEFRLMSKKPGIGATAVMQMASSSAKNWLTMKGDVPDSIKLEGRDWPLGRYLRERLVRDVGMDLSAVKEKRRLDREYSLATMTDKDRETLKAMQKLDREKAHRATLRAQAVIRSLKERKKL